MENKKISDSIQLVSLNQAVERESKWIEGRALLLADAVDIVAVDNDSQLESASAVYTRITKHVSALEKIRKSVTGPLDDLKKQIMSQERELKATLEAEAARIKGMNDAYATAKFDREQAERQAAIDAAAHAAIESDAAADLFGNADVQTASEPIIIPSADKPRTSAGRTVIRWEFEVIDTSQIPREFMSVDESKIRKYRDYQIQIGNEPSIPGVMFTRNISVESR